MHFREVGDIQIQGGMKGIANSKIVKNDQSMAHGWCRIEVEWEHLDDQIDM